ncbi:decarboxylating 6-phosphogluconate dehydrogenase [Candidatus Woesearchaeota archaeon]|nr:decarboxylating 6-phosphogluconate dehydrogenase [Candidatus Woesearchaeota archaeon]MBI2661035.1 decarboxylating 6-phosphogluconate dehydrogenase [Candidatus Woesearchaeota archaeon]
MKIGFIGLGRMGINLVYNLKDKGIDVIAYNRSPEPLDEVRKNGVKTAGSIRELVQALPNPRVIWVMVTAGKPVDLIIEELLRFVEKGDIIIDGGNSFYKDSVRRYKELSKKGINFLDCGTSGGLKGARYGACLTIGGDEKTFKKIEELFRKAATKDGYAYMGPPGAGHFVKVIHNGIEYALLQAYGEGFEILKKGPYKIDMEKTARVWSNGSIIRSYLTELSIEAFRKDPNLSRIEGIVGGGETGTWAVETSKELGVDAEILKTALELRIRTRTDPTFAGKVVAALRNEFGGHSTIENSKRNFQRAQKRKVFDTVKKR